MAPRRRGRSPLLLPLLAAAASCLALAQAEEEASNATVVWDPATLSCPESGSGASLTVWVSPVGEIVLPATHTLDHDLYEDCAEGRLQGQVRNKSHTVRSRVIRLFFPTYLAPYAVNEATIGHRE